MGKDESSLEESRKIREMLTARWGSIPGSIMRAQWGTSVIDLSTSYQDQKADSKWADTPFSLSSVGARHGGLSRMPQNVVRFATQFFTLDKLPVGDLGYFGNGLPTVLDPFAGHNSRLEAVFRSNRNYVGWDVSANFMRLNRQVKAMLEEENSRALFPIEAKMELVEGDSRDINYEGMFDFCTTSPPFYDLELDSYGPEIEQLGRGKSYNDFLWSLGQVVKSCYRALKPGAFIAWEFNDFRRDGEWYPFHADAIELFKRAEFQPWDIIIIDYGSGFLEAFASDIAHHHIVSKQHSYLIIGRKRPAQYRQLKRQETRERLLNEVQEAKVEGSLIHQPSLFQTGVEEELPDI